MEVRDAMFVSDAVPFIPWRLGIEDTKKYSNMTPSLIYTPPRQTSDFSYSHNIS